ncbi:MAG: HEAT repeat domain-containing protein, partial [Planctomycetaceae bacterium]|nr:HEAT repeat domain-containing protein [Planctomycetaceae bacterium]
EDGGVWPHALQAARKLFGADSLEPMYAVIQNDEFWIDAPSDQMMLDRVCSEGEPSRIMEIFPNVNESLREHLVSALLNRDSLPVKEAADSLTSSKEDVVDLAAHILGRAGQDASKQGDAVAKAIQTWRTTWEERRKERASRWGGHPVNSVTPCLTRLVWAAGRIGAAPKELIEIAESHTDDGYFRPVRLAAIRALVEGKANKQILELLESAAIGPDPEVRAVAAQALAEQDTKRATAMAEKMLSDRVSLERLAFAEKVDITPAMHTAAESAHYQGVALPVLIAAGDFDHLKTVAHNQDLPEATRLGAIESLARLGQEAAEEELATIGKNEKEEEDFRKAAWRA